MQGDALLYAAEAAARFLAEYRMQYLLSFSEAEALGLPRQAAPTAEETAYIHELNDVIANLRIGLIQRVDFPEGDMPS